MLDSNTQIKMCTWMTCAETNQDRRALVPTRNKRYMRDKRTSPNKCKRGFANTDTCIDILRKSQILLLEIRAEFLSLCFRDRNPFQDVKRVSGKHQKHYAYIHA